jgi:GntR family transcriptional regulator, transcriptional repressor for pyruvate dehydrogenase complex
MTDTQIGRRGNLTEALIGELSLRIERGVYAPGQKLPTEKQLCAEFGVSRTVVREAVASLRLGGRLFSRQGLGVFVEKHDPQKLNFSVDQIEGVVSAMRILELRLGVETEAVAHAAMRRTPEALVEIAAAYDRLSATGNGATDSQADADFDFHSAIARATGNPHFAQFLEALGTDISFDLRLKHARESGDGRDYTARIKREHGAILAAITQGNAEGARSAMRRHLEESLVRYRRLVNNSAGTGKMYAR